MTTATNPTRAERIEAAGRRLVDANPESVVDEPDFYEARVALREALASPPSPLDEARAKWVAAPASVQHQVIVGIWHSGIGHAHPTSAVGAAGRAAIAMLEATAATAAAVVAEEPGR